MGVRPETFMNGALPYNQQPDPGSFSLAHPFRLPLADGSPHVALRRRANLRPYGTAQ